MASTRNPSSPTCLHLRFGQRCRVSTSVSRKILSRPSSCRALPAFAIKSEERGRKKEELWIGSNGLPDSFAGWYEPGDGGGDSRRNNGFRGTLVAGVAGLLLAGGVAFAALSLSTRSAYGSKQELEPLKIEQEVLLSSYDNPEADRVENPTELPTNGTSKTSDCCSENETALQIPPGKVLVPPVVDQAQVQALAALQVLKVIEPDAQPCDLCTRREYARWLVKASSALSRNTISKVYPAMYIENVTELAFDDITPEDPDFPCIQGLAEAGLISSKLSGSKTNSSISGQCDSILFSPERPLSRQDLVSWKITLEKTQLPEVDKKSLYQCSGYIDIDQINPDTWPALVSDLSAGEQSITALAFGYTRLFLPDKLVTKAQAAVALSTGDAAEVVSEELARIEAETLAEAAVNANSGLVAQIGKDLNASFEKELAKEREKMEALKKLAEVVRIELEELRKERAEENNALVRGQAAVRSEKEALLKLRHEVEKQSQSLMSNKIEISFEKEMILKLQKEAENENQIIVQLQYELEVERKALSMARAWAEEEAKRARVQARALKEVRDHWELQGINVIVDGGLRHDASTGVTWLTVGKESPFDEAINISESLLEKLKSLVAQIKVRSFAVIENAQIKVRSSAVIEKIIQNIHSLISVLKKWAAEMTDHSLKIWVYAISKTRRSIDELQSSVCAFGPTFGDRAKRVAEDCRQGMVKIPPRFKK
ncbi:uncharacterized protein [Typha angustifolia]|uniref:uncharacterized protein n=1 Tax=Typha angustifolia TaxID=59011 RepID=UPI003C2FDCDA